MKQQTAMQLMIRYLEDEGLEKSGVYYKAKHLLEMEKEQIMKAVYDSYYQEEYYDVRGYYEQTYGKKEEDNKDKISNTQDNMDKNKTAVEYLIDLYEKFISSEAGTGDRYYYKDLQKDIEKAKQMEKEQMADAWEDGSESEYQYHVSGEFRRCSSDHYQERYGNKELIDNTQNNMDNNKTQTAVEWLAIQLYENMEMKGDGNVFDEILNQAKQMEKEQIIKSNRDGVDMVVNKENFITGHEYYTKTYGNKG